MGLFSASKPTVHFAWHKVPAKVEDFRWSEADIQSFIVLKLRDWQQDEPDAFIWHADMGGMKTDIRVAKKAKALGMEQGVPDLWFLFPDRRVLCVELKTRVGTVSKEQKARHKAMAAFGFEVHVVKAKSPADGWDQVLNRIRKFI